MCPRLPERTQQTMHTLYTLREDRMIQEMQQEADARANYDRVVEHLGFVFYTKDLVNILREGHSRLAGFLRNFGIETANSLSVRFMTPLAMIECESNEVNDIAFNIFGGFE